MGYDNLRLEKGMYRQSGMSFTQVLESLDPSENYRGTALEGTDAFQRQLKRFGIRAKGAGSSPVEKFFATMDSAVLFPEYIARTVRQGMEENDILPAIVATTTVIDAMDYRSIYAEMEEQEAGLAAVQVAGFATVAVSGSVGVGYVSLCADGQGGVKAGSGREYLVVSVDENAGTAVIML